MKGQVDYKLPKKMKKRRQLDALVDTVKLPRARKSSGSVQELLDSDSSENDEFSMPAHSSKKKNLCCAWQSIAAQIGLFMVTTACLTTCVGLVWVQWHIRHELDSLRKQVISVENSDKVTAEMLKFQSQLAEVNASLMSIKTGPGSLQELTNTVTEIQNKLKDVDNTNKQLQATVVTAKQFVDLPSKVKLFSETLASVGSDLRKLMTDLETLKHADLEKRVTALEAASNQQTTSPSRQVDNVDVMRLNESLAAGLQSLRQVLDQLSTRITVLEDFTHSQGSHSDLNSSWVTELVSKMVHEEIVPNNSTVEKGEFLVLRADMLGNFEKINDTIIVLDDELSALSGRLDSHDRALMNLTTAISNIRNMLTTGHDSSELTRSTATQTTSTAASSITTSPASIPTESAAGNKARPVLHIDGINTREDLHKAFNGGWPVENGMLDIDTLNDLGKANITKDDFKQFDANGDNLYNEEEIAEALGFHHNPR